MEIRSPSTARLARIICLVRIVRLVRLSEAAKGQELLIASYYPSRIVRLILHLFCLAVRLSGYFSCASTYLSSSRLPRAFPPVLLYNLFSTERV